jgi:hypothetical protein
MKNDGAIMQSLCFSFDSFLLAPLNGITGEREARKIWGQADFHDSQRINKGFDGNEGEEDEPCGRTGKA